MIRQEKQSRNAGKMHTHLSNDNNDGNQGRLAYAGTGKNDTGKGNAKTKGTGPRSSKQGLCRNWARYGRCPGYDVNDCGYDHPPHLAQQLGEAKYDDDLDRKAGNNDHFPEKGKGKGKGGKGKR